MGRMLESLKGNNGTRVAPPLANKQAVDAQGQDCVVDWEIAEEVPFVEVGGPGKKVELSPGLLKHSAQSKTQPPHIAIEPTAPPIAPAPKVVHLTPLKPMGVVYEPWPGVAPTSVHSDVVAYHQPEHPTSQQYAMLFDAMLAGAAGVSPKTLVLLGLRPNVGATTVLSNLGVIGALQRSLRVVLVDANPRRSGVAQKFGVAAATGLAEIADGTLAIEQALMPTRALNLHLLPAGVSAKAKSSTRAEVFQWVVAWLRERFDLLLIDGPAIEDVAEFASPLVHADGTYLVLPQSENSAGKSAAQTITRLGGRLSGLVHTHFDA